MLATDAKPRSPFWDILAASPSEDRRDGIVNNSPAADVLRTGGLFELVARQPAASGALWQSLVTSPDTHARLRELEAETTRLRVEINRAAQALVGQRTGAKQQKRHILELERSIAEYSEKQALTHLLDRVGPDAQRRLLEQAEFRREFDREEPCPSYVLSIDIRRSTELMLKAREPRLYAQFIITLAKQLRQVVLDNYGVFDKFTGDGILAFFPSFYSGSDAGFRALLAAQQSHELFRMHYEANYRCFISVLADVGLGIGVDYGLVHVVQIGGDFTVVGTPVVYACRMAGAPAGRTLLNRPAYEYLHDRYSTYCVFENTTINVKNEGSTVAYAVYLNGKNYEPVPPEWLDNSSSA